jgi:hypothetical protein
MRGSVAVAKQISSQFPTPNLQPPVIVPNEFDPYREALIVERTTIWPEEYDDWSITDRRRIEALLHADPQHATELEYIRQHSGFCRQITVTAADLERLAAV